MPIFGPPLEPFIRLCNILKKGTDAKPVRFDPSLIGETLVLSVGSENFAHDYLEALEAYRGAFGLGANMSRADLSKHGFNSVPAAHRSFGR